MLPFERAHVSLVCKRLSEPPRRLITLFGPRQTGNTTIICQALKRLAGMPHYYVAVDDPDPDPFPLASRDSGSRALMPGVRDTAWLVRQWRIARREAERRTRGFVLVLDEIHSIPQWSGTVKGLWDADRARDLPLHVVILDSVPLFMQSGLRESLAGRFETIRVTHWSFAEMAEAFGLDLYEYLYFGGYPGTVSLMEDPDRWRSEILETLVGPHIEKDILAMTRVDKPALLKQLFALVARYSGQIHSCDKMLEQLQE